MPGILRPGGQTLGGHRGRDYEIPPGLVYPVCFCGGLGLVFALYPFGIFLGKGGGPLGAAPRRPWPNRRRIYRRPALGLFPYPGKMAAANSLAMSDKVR